MKRVSGLGLLLLMAVVAVFAAGEAAGSLTTATEAWVVSGDAIKVEDQSFTIYLSTKANEILADYGTGSLFVTNNSCESTAMARICLDNIQYDMTARVYKIKVRGISLVPSIAITREAAKTEFLVGEEALFSVTLKNTGGFARNITYEDKFPKEFEVTSTDRMPLRVDRALWTGNLDTDESVSLSYKVKALGDFDGSLVSAVTYSDGLRLKTVYSTKIALKTSSPLVSEILLGDAAVLVGERDNVTINLTNRLPETAVINAEIIFDPGLRMVSRPYGVKASSLFTYTWDGEMVKGNATLNVSKALFFEFKGTRIGNSDIRARVSYRPKSSASAKTLPELKKSVVVSESGVTVRTSVKDSTFEANQGKRIRVWLQNRNAYARLNRVFANLSTGMVYLPNAYLEKMEPQEQVLLVDKFFYAPAVDTSTGYVLETNVSYLTEFGDNFTKTFKDTATVLPTQEVTLSQTVSSQSVKSGDEITVTVSIRNARLTSLKNIMVFDNISQEFELIGKNRATLEARSKESVSAYTYRLKAPHVGKETVFYVNTTLAYSDSYGHDPYLDPKEYRKVTITPVTVQPEDLPLTIARTVDDSTIYVGEPFTIRYVITNTASGKIAKNIVLELPLMYEFDRIGGDSEVRVNQLGPGESIALANSEKQRAKLPGPQEIKMASLEYENSYGDKYAVNGTATTVTVEKNYFKGPVILLEKIAPPSANNTGTFGLQLKVANVGTDAAAVTVEDDGYSYSIAVPSGSDYFINKTARYSRPGQVRLPQATASYSYNGDLMVTASKPALVEILDNPVLTISKAVPGNTNNIEHFTVLLGILNRVDTPIQNISVKDSGRAWTIPSISPGGSANITYADELKIVGQHALTPATLTYAYEGALYTVESNSPQINVEEKAFVTISKRVVPNIALPREKLRVTLSVKNVYNESLEVAVSDSGKSFSAALLPGMEKNFTYEMPANALAGEGAAAAYVVSGQEVTAVSAEANFTLQEGTGPETSEVEQARPSSSGTGGFFSRLVKKVVSILTWKRGG